MEATMEWYFYVFALILWPTDPPVASQARPEVWQALKEISVGLELVGPHENWASDFRSELRYVRHYWRTLQDAPRLADCNTLPSSAAVAELCRLNEQYQCHVQTQQAILIHRADDLAEVLREARQLYQVWDAVRRATGPNQAWAYRRRMLRNVREMVGEQAYYSGQLPPAVPVWRFQRID
ncbi:MAG: hypothetical protein K2R98_02895 [Gemmataceae bacterium]|nr:hypothetical protein [Gemmataceae bacterium]